MKLMGAKIRYYPVGEDEQGADLALYERAEVLSQEGGSPYVIPLSGDHVPYGALGYVKCAEEILLQLRQRSLSIDGIVLPSGSATTHAGLLTGLRALGSHIPVYGFCVRRGQTAQAERVLNKAQKVAGMINHPGVVTQHDIWVDDRMFHPGYGQLNEDLLDAIRLTAKHEGLLLDPTYSGKAMAGLIYLVASGHFDGGHNIMFLHTGGTPALFAYPEILESA